MSKEEMKELILSKIKKSKLTEEQIKHFKNKGKFSAIYNPFRTDDISGRLRQASGKEVIIYCNYETVPCIDAPRLFGEYKFFIEGAESSGWVSEVEFENISIVDDYAEIDTWNCDHQYLMLISSREIAEKELGNYGKDCELPLIIGRVYGSKQHDYFKSLTKADLYLYKFKEQDWEILN